jgi:hypothetical protein
MRASTSARAESGPIVRPSLDRRGDSADDLKVAMDASWSRFAASCSAAQDPRPIGTEYEYTLAAGLFDSVNKDHFSGYAGYH